MRRRRAKFFVTIDGAPAAADELFTFVVSSAEIVRIRVATTPPGFRSLALHTRDEGTLWARGWEGEAVTALEVAAVLR